MAATRVPVDISFEHFMAVRSILRHIMEDLEMTVGSEPKWLTCRLNQSDTTEPTAFFLGWIENAALSQIRTATYQPDPGLFRFMDPVHGTTYGSALKKAPRVLRQSWSKPDRTKSPLAPFRLYQRKGHYGITDSNEIARLSVAIKVRDRFAGTLNTGLSVDPGTRLDSKMMQWAQSPSSELVQYVRNEFVPGGPFVSGAANARASKGKAHRRA
jgi:hypothetical protein